MSAPTLDRGGASAQVLTVRQAGPDVTVSYLPNIASKEEADLHFTFTMDSTQASRQCWTRAQQLKGYRTPLCAASVHDGGRPKGVYALQCGWISVIPCVRRKLSASPRPSESTCCGT